MKNNKLCPKGQRWCPITKKCIPDNDNKGKGQRLGRGQGKGPIGIPLKTKIEEATNLVDLILKEDPSLYKAIVKSNKILDEVENKLEVPNQDVEQLQQDISSEISKDEEQKDVEDMKTEKPIEEMMKQTVKLLVTEEVYRDFFKAKLKKWKIKSPGELSDTEKKKFFDEIEKEWTKEKN